MNKIFRGDEHDAEEGLGVGQVAFPTEQSPCLWQGGSEESCCAGKEIALEKIISFDLGMECTLCTSFFKELTYIQLIIPFT